MKGSAQDYVSRIAQEALTKGSTEFALTSKGMTFPQFTQLARGQGRFRYKTLGPARWKMTSIDAIENELANLPQNQWFALNLVFATETDFNLHLQREGIELMGENGKIILAKQKAA